MVAHTESDCLNSLLSPMLLAWGIDCFVECNSPWQKASRANATIWRIIFVLREIVPAEPDTRSRFGGSGYALSRQGYPGTHRHQPPKRYSLPSMAARLHQGKQAVDLRINVHACICSQHCCKQQTSHVHCCFEALWQHGTAMQPMTLTQEQKQQQLLVLSHYCTCC